MATAEMRNVDSGAPTDDATYDLCVMWTTEHDAGFVELLEAACRARSLTLLQITPTNVESLCEDVLTGSLSFRALFDRASDEDRNFFPLVEWARNNGVFRINPYEMARRTWDKAAMHTAVSDSVPTPHTLFIPPYNSDHGLSDLDLSPLGPSFTIKPAHGGGGAGVVVVATSIDQVIEARQQYPDDMYMLQQRVVPTKIDGNSAWFRIIYSNEHSYPCWWDSDTHVYRPVTVAEEAHYGIGQMRDIMQALAEACELQLFSSEIAIDIDDKFLVVDYVNDPLDLTLASKKNDGVPDDIVGFIAEDLAELVLQRTK